MIVKCKYSSREAKEGEVASLRVSSSFYGSPLCERLHRHPPSATLHHTRIPAKEKVPVHRKAMDSIERWNKLIYRE